METSIQINRKFVWVAVAVILLIVMFVLIGTANLGSKKKTDRVSDLNSLKAIPGTEINIKSVNYNDPLGFSFSYNDNYEINTNPDDVDNYANIDITPKNKEGLIKIKISDTTFNDIAEWGNSTEISGASFLDSKMGNLDAKKGYQRQSNKMVIAAIWDGMLLKIEVSPTTDKNLVTDTEKLINSLNIPEKAKFADEAVSNNAIVTDGGDTGGGDVAVDEGEEMVE